MKVPLLGIHIIRQKTLAKMLAEAETKMLAETQGKNSSNRLISKLLGDNVQLAQHNLEMARKLGKRK